MTIDIRLRVERDSTDAYVYAYVYIYTYIDKERDSAADLMRKTLDTCTGIKRKISGASILHQRIYSPRWHGA